MAEQMKPSGIDWIGDVPANWYMIKLKYFSYLKGRIGWQGLTADEFIDEGPYLITGTDFENGKIQFDRSYHISDERYNQAPEIQLKVGDLLVTKDGTVGKMAYVDMLPGKASLNSHLLLIRPLENKFDNRFLFWLMSSSVFSGYTEYAQDGTVMASLSQEKIGNFIAYFPEITEQQAIADFLYKECAQIDSIAADLEKQIALLQQYKKSLITETVTKGLDKSVPMKDSGIEGVGKIPTHWTVNRLKYAALVKTGPFGTQLSASEYSDEGIPVINVKNIGYGTIIEDDLDYVPDEVCQRLTQHQLQLGDIVFGRKGAVDKHAIITESQIGWVQGSDCIRVRIDGDIDSRYLNYLFDTVYFAEYVLLYQQNVLSVMEEVWHKEGERIDLVIFLNGIAIFTFELKCNTNGQNYEDAIRQYKFERDYKTRLLKFKAGCLAHFAMDLNEVYMCTHLKGRSSFFLPFNKGRGVGIHSGKGNPHNEIGINVSYMWEDILKKDTVLYLIDKIIFLQKETKKDPDTGKRVTKETLIFPRYHQFNAVRKLVADVVEHHSEKNYLIEHSAGSGKTNTIAWLAHRLASLHDGENKVIFDTVCIITDRIVVDRQLQNAVLSLEHKVGLIKVMDEKCTSKDLADALNSSTKIIVTTIHKFMYIQELVQELKSKTFAVIIDEAHSSTAGTAMEAVTYALSESRKLSEATPVDVSEEEKSMGDIIEDEIARSGKQPNVSMIAFTATPKPTTLQLFGCLNEEGKKVAFDLYSMKQAIEEGFILDVLQNYVTYKTYFEINKAIEDDPELETISAKRKIAKYIELHDTNIAQKVEIIIEHFKNRIMQELGGKAKAMVITSSRQAAVKYRNEFETYISKHGYTGIRALVAFSGKVSLDGHEYTEAVMNGIKEEDLPEVFDSNSYQVLLVANKYQTGFDQPKLCAMYVDKRLRGVNAVQTLSRLNRICAPYDKKTFVLDFKNEYEDIQASFAPFYTETILNETITPSDIRTVEAQVDQYNFLDIDDIEEFNGYLYQDKRTSKEKARMWALLDQSLQIINRHPELEKLEIRATIKRFLRFYSFLIQATCFESVDLHKKYNFLSYLVKEIEVGSGGNDFDIADKITASNFRQKKTEENTHEIESKPEVSLPTPNEVFMDEAVKKKLSEIIDEINAAYNKNFDVDVASKSALQMRDILLKNGHLRDSARNNSLKDFRFAYFDAVQDALIAGYEQNQDFFALLLDNDEKKRELMQVFLEDVYKNLRE